MLNGINPKDFDWDDLNHQVRRAVITGEEIETQDKPDEILRYQQKVAEFMCLYHQWDYAWLISVPSIFAAVLLTEFIGFLSDPNGKHSLFYFSLIVLSVVIVVISFLVYHWKIKQSFDGCQRISLNLEKEIQIREMQNSQKGK